MTERTALVTGAGSLVGRAIAEALGREGVSVALVGRRLEKIEPVEAAIRAAGGQAHSFVADVARIESAQELVARVGEALGPIDILVNNAGVHGGFAPVTQSDPASWRNTILTNLFAPYLLCRLCAPGMLARGWGRIVNISSAAGLSAPGSRSSDYILSKNALNYFTRQLATEFDDTPIACCAIHPGEVKSEMWAAIRADALARGEEGKGALAWAELVERTGGDPPEKAADLVLRILNSNAAGINGRFLWIDGGLQTPRESW